MLDPSLCKAACRNEEKMLTGFNMFCLVCFFHRDIWRRGLGLKKGFTWEVMQRQVGLSATGHKTNKQKKKWKRLFRALWKWNNTQERWQGVSCHSWWSLVIQSHESQGRGLNQEMWEQEGSSGTLWFGMARWRNFRSSRIPQKDSLGILKTARFLLLVLTLVGKWNEQIEVHLPFFPPQLSFCSALYLAFVCLVSRLSYYPYTPFWPPLFFSLLSP